VSGLVLYQLVFVVNVMRVVTSQEEWGDDAVRREDDHVGDHPHFGLFGLTFDTDIAMSTALALAIIIFMGYRLRKTVTDGVPGKFQLIWEILLVDMVGDLVKSSLGDKGKRFIPLGMTVFVLCWSPIGLASCRLRCIRAIGRDLSGPTSDVNLPLALALFVIVWVHIESLRERHLGATSSITVSRPGG